MSIKVTPVNRAGHSRTATVRANYKQICDVLGFEPNVEDDPDKVEASWGFRDEKGRVAYLWCYKIGKDRCREWSADGDVTLLHDLFGRGSVRGKWG